VFTALWLFQARRHRLVGIVLLASSLTGLAFVNHRSAYVGMIVAGLVYVLAHPRREPSTRRLVPTMLIATLAGLILLGTPLGQAGLDRVIATVDTDDPNVQFRFGAVSGAVQKDDVWEAAFGSGVGLQPTELGGAFEPLTVTRIEPHNSYVSMFQRGGVVGVLLMLAPMVYCLREMLRQRADPQIRILLSIAVFTLVMAGFNVVLENFYFGIWAWLPLLAGTMLALSRRTGGATARTPRRRLPTAGRRL
jgi:O-antigen ligase